MTETTAPPTASAAPRLRAVRLYVVTAAAHPPARTLDVVRAAVDGGADAVQLRRKGDEALAVLRLAERCREVTASAGALLVVNDRVDLAVAAGADGVHLGQDDLPLAAARRLWPDGLLGSSTHSLEQALAAERDGADYLGVGPVHATPTKPGRPAVGLALVAAVAARVSIPWVAIGGIDDSTVDAVLAAGARAVAVVRAVCDTDDPRQAAVRLARRLAEARR